MSTRSDQSEEQSQWNREGRRSILSAIIIASMILLAIPFAVIGTTSNGEAGALFSANMAPSEPTNLTAESDATGVWLNWTAPASDGGSPIVNYIIYRWDNDTWPPYTLTTTFPSDWSQLWCHIEAEQWELLGGVTTYFYVTATNANGESMKSNDANVTAYFVPWSVSIISDWGYGAITDWGDGFAYLDWEAPGYDGGLPINEYLVHRERVMHNDTGPEERVDLTNISIPPDQTEFNDTSVVNGLDYVYWVNAVNDVGEGSAHGGREVRPGSPSEVLNLDGIVGDGFVDISWGPPIKDCGSPVTNYIIYRTDQSTSYPYEKRNFSISSDATFFNDTSAPNGHQLMYNVYAYNSLGVESKSYTAFYGTPHAPYGIPPNPSNLQAAWEHDAENKLFVTLTWTPPISDEYSSFNYNIYMAGGMFLKFLLNSTSQPCCIDYKVSANIMYSYYVTASAGGLESGRTNIVNITPGLPLDAPQDFLAIPGHGFMNLSWKAPYLSSEVIEYNVYRGNSSNTMELLSTVPASTTCWNDTTLDGGVTYYYSVKTVGPGGESSSSSILEKTAREYAPGDANLMTFVIIGTVLAAIVAIAALWRFMKWDNKKKISSIVVILAVTASIILASVIFVDAGMNGPNYDAREPQIGDFFEYGVGFGESASMRVLITSVGDTTMTLNITMNIPDQEPVTMEQTWQKNSTMGMGLLQPGSSDDLLSLFSGGSVVNETLPTEWGYLWTKHTTMSTGDIMGMGINMTLEMWEYAGVMLEMRMSMKTEMMGSSMETSMRMLTLIDTNIPQILYP